MEDELSDLVLTSKLGTFVFDRHTILSYAKLIRDSVTGQFFNPRPGEVRVKDEQTAWQYTRTLGRNLEGIGFDLRIDFGL